MSLKQKIQEKLNRKTKEDFKALLVKIANSKGGIKKEHAEVVLRDIDGDNHFVNVSWYFGLGYSYALREVLAVLEGNEKETKV
jgi:hypothetical protein